MRDQRISARILESERMVLIPGTANILRSELENREAFSAQIGALVPAAWPPELYSGTREDRLESLTADPDLAGWLHWYWVLNSDALTVPILVGVGGFSGYPDDSKQVEIGFSVLAHWQRRGLATEAVSRLLRWAKNGSFNAVLAQTYSEIPASIRVLEKCDFTQTFEPSNVDMLRYKKIF